MWNSKKGFWQYHTTDKCHKAHGHIAHINWALTNETLGSLFLDPCWSPSPQSRFNLVFGPYRQRKIQNNSNMLSCIIICSVFWQRVSFWKLFHYFLWLQKLVQKAKESRKNFKSSLVEWDFQNSTQQASSLRAQSPLRPRSLKAKVLIIM